MNQFNGFITQLTLNRDQSNANVWTQAQVQLRMQCENFHLILCKPILSYSRYKLRANKPTVLMPVTNLN